jgi:hypothetical protein
LKLGAGTQGARPENIWNSANFGIYKDQKKKYIHYLERHKIKASEKKKKA